MADPLWTTADIQKLKEAVASGALSVSYDGPPARSITYQSLASMRALLAEMVAQVSDAAGTRSKHRYAAHKKGFYP